MPTKKKKVKQKRQPYGARITRTGPLTRKKRVAQNLTRDCRIFKTSTSIATVTGSNGQFRFSANPLNVADCKDFQKWGACWEEFQVLSFSCKFLPVAVGSESLLTVGAPAGAPFPLFLRGNTVSWVDQGDADPTTNEIADLIVRPSAKLIASRKPHYRFCTRPKGNPNWGTFDNDGNITVQDEWEDSRIKLFGRGFSDPTPPATRLIFYYVMLSFKVVFRGRQQIV